MTLSEFADIADLLAAAGVIGSLLFLAIELRKSNRDTQQSNWRDLLTNFRDYKAVTNDLEFAKFVIRANQEYHALTEAEKLSYGQYLEQGIHVMGNFNKHRGMVPGTLTGLLTAVHNSLYDLLSPPGARAWIAESRERGRLMPETYNWVDKVLEEGRRTIG